MDDDVKFYRERAAHARHMSDLVYQADVRADLFQLGVEYDELADDVEKGAAVIRHAHLLRRSAD
jgi:hypothetical protein